MEDILSTSKTTYLHSFPNFDEKFQYSTINNESTDFQFFAFKKSFIQVNNKSDLHILKIRSFENKDEILKVKQMHIENLYCTACPKIISDDVALGLSSGSVKILNYKTKDFVVKFPAEKPNNGVVFLDFNASDEYLSSVYENGTVNIYGLKTKIKLQTQSFDRNCTLARFHPAKQFFLGAASSKGGVYYYDVQNKRILFHSANSHGAPCKDICLPSAHPDMMLSVGYDSLLNIFDIRKKTSPQQIQFRYPLSTISVSFCGKYFCVGNLKGELISYDFRSLKTDLSSRKIHKDAVIRVGFVPNITNSNSCSDSIQSEFIRDKSLLRRNVDHKPNVSQKKRDSFCDFIDISSSRKDNSKQRRDSFLDFIDINHPTEEESKKSSLFKRNSLDWGSLNEIHRKDFEENTQSCSSNLEESFESTYNKASEITDCSGKNSSKHSRRSDNNFNALFQTSIKSVSADNLSEIETDAKNFKKSYLNFARGESLANSNSFTPIKEEINSNFHVQTSKNSTTSLNLNDIAQKIENLHSDMNKKFNFLQSEINFIAENSKCEILNQNFYLWKQQKDEINHLLTQNDISYELLRLRKENEGLRKLLGQRLNNT